MNFAFNWLLAITAMFQVASALRFNLEAHPQGSEPRCIREFATANTMVVVHARSDGYVGDGQKVSIIIQDAAKNRYAFRDQMDDSYRQTFTPSHDTSFDVCFTNTLTQGRKGHLSRSIELDIEIGARARDLSAMQALDKLKPSEANLQQADEIAQEIISRYEYLREREERLRDTNESTNRRIKNFFVLTILTFVGLGAWQVQHLRTYFRSKHII